MQSLLLNEIALTRRSALIGVGALGLGAMAEPIRSAPPPAASTSTSVGSDQLYDFGKVWAGYEKPMIGAFHGVMYLRAGDKKAVPLFGFAGVGVNQARMTPDGLLMKARETGYFTDLATGDVLERWDNPFTGETVDVYHFYDDLLASRVRSEQVAATMSFAPLGAEDVLVSWDYAGEKTNPVTPEGWPSYSTGPKITASEHFTLYVSAKDLADRDLPTVRSRGSFCRVSQPWPFMKLGRSPLKDATLFGRMFTHKGLSGYGEIPPKILAYMEKHAPLYLEAPTGWDVAEGTGSAKRLDTWMAFAGDIPPETAGYPWTQQLMSPGLAPPTGLAAKFRS